MKIPLMDLTAQYTELRTEIDTAMRRVVDSGRFVGGPEVAAFNRLWAAYVGTEYALGCGNGTDAIEIALDALGIGAGDEVIVPAMSWISTSEAVATRGAVPVFVDIDPQSRCIDPELVAARITPRTRALLIVHLYGHPCNMDRLTDIAEAHDLPLIEDCAQAHGATWRGRKLGTFGRVSTFSFFPSKSLGAYGDAGAICTNDAALHERMRAIANHGMPGKRHIHHYHGRNSRLDALQAAVLSVKIPYLDRWIEAKNRVAERYDSRLRAADVPGERLQLPTVGEAARHGYHLYVIQTPERDELGDYLSAREIDNNVHYPTALPYHLCYRDRSPAEGDFSVAVHLSRTALSLPIYAEMTAGQVDQVCDALIQFFKK